MYIQLTVIQAFIHSGIRFITKADYVFHQCGGMSRKDEKVKTSSNDGKM